MRAPSTTSTRTILWRWYLVPSLRESFFVLLLSRSPSNDSCLLSSLKPPLLVAPIPSSPPTRRDTENGRAIDVPPAAPSQPEPSFPSSTWPIPGPVMSKSSAIQRSLGPSTSSVVPGIQQLVPAQPEASPNGTQAYEDVPLNLDDGWEGNPEPAPQRPLKRKRGQLFSPVNIDDSGDDGDPVSRATEQGVRSRWKAWPGRELYSQTSDFRNRSSLSLSPSQPPLPSASAKAQCLSQNSTSHRRTTSFAKEMSHDEDENEDDARLPAPSSPISFDNQAPTSPLSRRRELGNNVRLSSQARSPKQSQKRLRSSPASSSAARPRNTYSDKFRYWTMKELQFLLEAAGQVPPAERLPFKWLRE